MLFHPTILSLFAILPLTLAYPTDSTHHARQEIDINVDCDDKCNTDANRDDCKYECELAKAKRWNAPGYWYSSRGTECQFGCLPRFEVSQERIEIGSLGRSGRDSKVHDTTDTIFSFDQFVEASLNSGCPNGQCATGEATWEAWAERYKPWDNSRDGNYYSDPYKAYFNRQAIPKFPQAAWASGEDAYRCKMDLVPGDGFGNMKVVAHMKTHGIVDEDIGKMFLAIVMALYKKPGAVENESLLMTKCYKDLRIDTTDRAYLEDGLEVNNQVVPRAITVTMFDNNQRQGSTFEYSIKVCSDVYIESDSCSKLGDIIGNIGTLIGLIPTPPTCVISTIGSGIAAALSFACMGAVDKVEAQC